MMILTNIKSFGEWLQEQTTISQYGIEINQNTLTILLTSTATKRMHVQESDCQTKLILLHLKL